MTHWLFQGFKKRAARAGHRRDPRMAIRIRPLTGGPPVRCGISRPGRLDNRFGSTKTPTTMAAIKRSSAIPDISVHPEKNVGRWKGRPCGSEGANNRPWGYLSEKRPGRKAFPPTTRPSPILAINAPWNTSVPLTAVFGWRIMRGNDKEVILLIRGFEDKIPRTTASALVNDAAYKDPNVRHDRRY